MLWELSVVPRSWRGKICKFEHNMSYMARACSKAGDKTWKCLHRAHKAPYRWGNGEVRLREVTQNTKKFKKCRRFRIWIRYIFCYSDLYWSKFSFVLSFSPPFPSPSPVAPTHLPPACMSACQGLSRCCPGWPQTHNPPDSTSLVLVLQVWHHTQF